MKHPIKRSNQLIILRGVIPLPVSLIMLILLISCSDNGTPLDPAGPDENLTFEEIFARGGNFEEIPQSRSTDTLAVTEPYNEDYNTQEGAKDIIQRFVCSTKTLSVLDGNGKFPLFNTNADVIYPANLLQGKTLSNATPSPIPVQRAGGTISTTRSNACSSPKTSKSTSWNNTAWSGKTRIIPSASWMFSPTRKPKSWTPRPPSIPSATGCGSRRRRMI
ncbi:MAG: hypothetical protein R6V27_09525 [Balneolaceae bacterium]